MAALYQIHTKVIPPTEEHLCTFICLHDCVSSGQRLCTQLFKALDSAQLNHVFPHARFVFPEAPFLTTAHKGKQFLSWFSTVCLDLPSRRAPGGEWQRISDVVDSVEVLVEEESERIGRDRTFLVGFGMGCSVGMALLLKTGEPLAGFFGMGGWAPYVDDLTAVAARGELDQAEAAPAIPGPVFDDFAGNAFNSYTDMPGNNYVDDLFGEGSLEWQESMPTFTEPAPAPAVTSSTALSQTPFSRLLRVTNFFRALSGTADAAAPSQTAATTPMMLVHATDDAAVNLSHGTAALKLFKGLGFNPRLVAIEHGGGGEGHGVTEKQLRLLLGFMRDSGGVPFAVKEVLVEEFNDLF